MRPPRTFRYEAGHTWGGKLSAGASIEPGREMKLAKDQIAVGDSFTKAGTWSGSVYVVTAFFNPPGLPPHVRLASAGQGDRMLMSISAILDPRFWRRVPAAT
jgi:hypothetical protein